MFLRQGYGGKAPIVPHREAIKEKQSGSEALPDGLLSHSPVLFSVVFSSFTPPA